MRRLLIVVAAIAAVTGATAATAQEIPTATPDPCLGAGAAARSIIKDAYPHKRWHHQHPLSDNSRGRLRDLSSCLGPNDRRNLREHWQDSKEEFFTYRAYRKIATVPGLHEGDPYLRWLVIPAWVVAAETRGYSGESRWHAQNASGACGPYQLLGHTSCAVANNQDKLRMHEVAASLPRGSWAVGY